MGRLVDIEDVKDFINGLDSLPWEEELDDLVKMIPTAYDVEKVVAQLEERKGNVFIDGKKMYQEDYFIDIDDAIEIINQLAEEHKGGWIPCSEKLPQENEPVDAVCEVVNIMLKSGTVTSGWCNRYLERWYVLDECCDYPLQQNYEDVIAWQPLPAPYQPKGE